MKNKQLFGINIGTSSALIIIVILSLVCFSGLSIASASADYRLSQKLAQRTTAYYAACNQAQEELHSLSDTLLAAYRASQGKEDYEAKIKESIKDSLNFTYVINDNQYLEVSVTPLYPDENDGRLYEITRFQVANISSPELDTSLPVFGNN